MTAKVLIIFALVSYASAAVKLQELFSWNVMDWKYPDAYTRQQAILTGALVPENALPVGIERWKNKLFVSVPRWQGGEFIIIPIRPGRTHLQSLPNLL